MTPWTDALQKWIARQGNGYMTAGLLGIAAICIIAAVFFTPLGKAGLLAWIVAP